MLLGSTIGKNPQEMNFNSVANHTSDLNTTHMPITFISCL